MALEHSVHGIAHHVADKVLSTDAGKAVVTGGAGLLVAAAPVIAPALALAVVGAAATGGIMWGLSRMGRWFDKQAF